MSLRRHIQNSVHVVGILLLTRERDVTLTANSKWWWRWRCRCKQGRGTSLQGLGNRASLSYTQFSTITCSTSDITLPLLAAASLHHAHRSFEFAVPVTPLSPLHGDISRHYPHTRSKLAVLATSLPAAPPPYYAFWICPPSYILLPSLLLQSLEFSILVKSLYFRPRIQHHQLQSCKLAWDPVAPNTHAFMHTAFCFLLKKWLT